jgi:predicted nucleotidyltransferase
VTKTLEAIKTTLSNNAPMLKDKYKVKRLGVFGSFARGEQHQASDLDILVEFEGIISLLDLVGLEICLTELLGTKVEVVPKEDLRPELRDEVLMSTIYL